MNFSFLLVICLATVANCAVIPEITSWEEFKLFFGKSYETPAEEALRKETFENALKFIRENQNNEHGIKFGIHEHSDRLPGEMVMDPILAEEFLKGLKSEKPAEIPDLEYDAQPASFDWRQHAQFQPVVNQGSCGSCWAFATSFTVEAALAIKSNIHVMLSKQQLVDCSSHNVDSRYRNQGCNIGYPTDTFAYIKTMGLYENQLYPYNGKANEACNYNALTHQYANTHKYTIKSYNLLPQQSSDDNLMSVLRTYGPVVIVIHGTDPVFQHYKGGIIRNLLPNSQTVNHVVAVVGWGSENGVDYWIIRNSWGVNWGEAGHVRVERHHNFLAINNWISYPML